MPAITSLAETPIGSSAGEISVGGLERCCEGGSEGCRGGVAPALLVECGEGAGAVGRVHEVGAHGERVVEVRDEVGAVRGHEQQVPRLM